MHDCYQGGVKVDRGCDSPKGGAKGIKNVCQLVGRCDGFLGNTRRILGGVTVVRECGSSKGGVSRIKKVCQLMVRCAGHGGCNGA